ncbi:hypothetical protein Nepgr_004370 [Nepenthes gracilis]|uniref:(S)-ureidoglycine aminohydrolase cupin domain-containing protein n=1 Tax=Nepenthes gracilis TaxID=150966 RepID=A0AAD3S1B0_NEPGR|nr:hypothetical protein Nepgr_004370 [Nepenthes gracilis]
MATSYTETFGVKIWRNPTESMLTELEVLKWNKWGCDPSKFPWKFDSGSEKMYFLKGKVKECPSNGTSSKLWRSTTLWKISSDGSSIVVFRFLCESDSEQRNGLNQFDGSIESCRLQIGPSNFGQKSD